MAVAGGALDISSSTTRLPILDGLRGIGLIVIMLVHFRSVEEPAAGAWLERIWHFGLDMGVIALDVFFVLSGFLITRILLDSKGSRAYFATFYARRVLRIFPVYYGFLVGYFILLPHLAEWAEQVRISPLQHFYYWTYTTNIAAGLNDWLNPAQAGTVFPFHHSTTHLWSLALEEQFYLAWPAVVHFCSLSGMKRACVACIVLAPIARVILVFTLGPYSNAAYVLTPARMDGIAWGALIAVILRQPGILPQCLWMAKRVALLAAGVLFGIYAYEGRLNGEESALFQTLGLTGSVYLGASLVVMSLAAQQEGRCYQLFANPILRSVGGYSYATYVLHLPLRFMLEWTGLFSKPAANLGLVAELEYSVPMVALSLAGGVVIWHTYEKHWLNLRRHL